MFSRLIFSSLTLIIIVDHSNEFFFYLIDIQIYLISDLLSLRNILLSLKLGLSYVIFNVRLFYLNGKAKILADSCMNNVPGSMIFWVFGFSNFLKLEDVTKINIAPL